MTNVKAKYGLKPIIRIKELLEEHNLTQKELAEMTGETPQQVNKWVMGVEPCLSALGHIAITLGVKLNDLVWHKGDDTEFNANSTVYIRGEAVGTSKNKPELLDSLKQYYRWTDEEFNGIKIINLDTKKGELVLGCINEGASKAFIAWAKKDRDCMYRL